MKKFLSMVLALVMVMSLVTVSAGAKSFTDDSKITYKEAVDVVSEIGIVDGYEDGAFNPTNTLTRGAAAKIICNLILGPTTANALSADTAPYSDVPTSNTFAGYIAYCAQKGIISGYADGTFRPAATLTGYAFMKMLLGALGYDASKEDYVGANWSIQVAKQAKGIGLDDGYKGEFVGTQAVTREEACLFAFNTLQANMVEYENKSSIVIGDITVNTSSEYKDKTCSVGSGNDGNIDRDGKVQFAEEFFGNLKLRAGQDDFARPANVWTLKANEIGTYAKEADATYTKKVEVGDIYKDLGLAKTIAKGDVSVYIDGLSTSEYAKLGSEYKAYSDKQPAVALKKGDDDNKFGANGVLTEVFYDDDNGSVIITKVNTYVGEVVKTVAATSKKDAYIQLTTMDPKPSKAGGSEEFETAEEFEDDAIVQYTYSQSAEEVKSVTVTETVSGTATKIINKTNNNDQNNGMTIDGTDYKVAAKSSGEILGAASVKNDYTVYLDQYGYILYIEEEEMSSNYALLLATATSTTFVGKKAELVFTDGSTAVVTTDKNYNTGSNKIDNNTIVTYKEDEDGVYTLKAVSSKQSNGSVNTTASSTGASDDFNLKNDKASITIEGSTKVTANSKSMFVVQDPTDSEDYTAYVGIKNAPTIEAANAFNKRVTVYYYCKTGNMVTAMFVFPQSKVTVEDSNANMLFIAGKSVSNLMHTSNSDYFEYDAVIDGEITTVMVDDAAGLGNKLNGLYKSYSKDKYDVITKVTPYDDFDDVNNSKKEVLEGVGIDKRSADYTVILDTQTGGAQETLTVDDDAVYYYVDKDGEITISSYKAISKDENDKVYAVVEDFLVKALFVQEVPDDDDTTETVEIPSNIVPDISDLNALTVMYRDAKGDQSEAPNAMDAVEYLRTALSAKYEVGAVTKSGDNYLFTLNGVTGMATFDSSTGIIAGAAISVNGTSMLLDAETELEDLTDKNGDALTGRFMQVIDKAGAETYEATTTNTTKIADGSKYEGGYYDVAMDATSFDGTATNDGSKAYTGSTAALEEATIYVKPDKNDKATVEVTLTLKVADANTTATTGVTAAVSSTAGADVTTNLETILGAGDALTTEGENFALTAELDFSGSVAVKTTLKVTIADPA